MAEQLLREGAADFARKVFDDVREFSKDPVIGISRQGYSEKENKVHEYVKAWGRSMGLEEKVDRCGNLFLTLPGRDRSLPCYMTGSHGDSVPQGGHYDGLAGVVAGMTVIYWLKRQGVTLRRDLTLVVFRMEESSWFGKAYVGSLAMTGQLTRADLALRHRSKDQTLADAVREAGFDPEDMIKTEPSIDLSRIAAFTELHIEQGPALDSNPKARVGIVTGIRGNLRHKLCRCLGVTAHSGAVDKRYRHDAVMATAELLSRMDRHWDAWLARGEDLVFTTGVLSTAKSAAISVIPGEVSFTLDIRSLSMDTLRRFLALFEAEAAAVGADRGVKFEFDKTLATQPSKLDPELAAHLEESARRTGIAVVRLPSGAGHDTAVLSNKGIPASMIFVANQDGSHNPYEKMKLEDFMLGVEVLYASIASYDD
ncbi:MAG: Zn-dependent hydrolase [Mesosutterella sp.]|nr:Zn-dependent hydrolase [Mesosutterella sp.]